MIQTNQSILCIFKHLRALIVSFYNKKAYFKLKFKDKNANLTKNVVTNKIKSIINVFSAINLQVLSLKIQSFRTNFLKILEFKIFIFNYSALICLCILFY